MTHITKALAMLLSYVRVLAATVALVLIGGCAANLGGSSPEASLSAEDAAKAKSRPVKIAMLLPLGGLNRTAAIAKSMKQAGEMALFELNNPNVQLVVKDDKGTAEGAQTAAAEAIREGAEIILGPLFSQAVPGAAAAARPANIPVVAFSNDRNVAGNGVYLMSYLPDAEVDRIVSYATANGKRRFAALIPDDAYGRTVEQSFRSAVGRHGGSIVALKSYPVGANANAILEPAREVFDTIKQVSEIGASVDALFLPGGQDSLPQIGPMIAYSGVNPATTKIIGTGAWEFPNIGRDPAFVGGWYPSPDPRGWRNFAGRFSKNFGHAPPRIASLAHDAVSIAINLSTNPTGSRYTPENLMRASGFSGVDGPVRFNRSGLAERGLAILEVRKFGSSVIDPAPASLTRTQLSAAPRRASYEPTGAIGGH